MKKNRIIFLIVLIVVVITIFYSFKGEDSGSYVASIENEREERDRFMKNSPESPFANAETPFKGLKYFPPDPAYRVVARLLPVEQKKPVTLTTNDGKQQNYIEYAHAEFKLNGQTNRLLILEVIDMGPFRGTLFLAFADETSADETYGAGRYLDLKKSPGSTTVTLDFNKAYNPYCAYNDSYTCPLPPRENILTIPIRAGEKTYQGSGKL